MNNQFMGIGLYREKIEERTEGSRAIKFIAFCQPR